MLLKFTLSISKVRASCIVSSPVTFSCTLHLLLRAFSLLMLQKSLLLLINNQRYDFSPLIALYLWFCALITAWDCLNFLIFKLSSASSLFLCFLSFPAWVGFFWASLVSHRSPPFWTFAFFFSLLFLASFIMARTKVTDNPPPPNVNYKSLYPWASDELLAETSTLTSIADWRAHLDSEPKFKGRAFGRESDAYISVRPCTEGKPVCMDSRANEGEPFFFFYQTVFKRIRQCLPFNSFERELLIEINVAPAQLHPNSWAFIRALSHGIARSKHV